MPTFYRAVLSETPDVLDFTSNQAKGKPRREPYESVEEWSGISVYDTEERCRRKAERFGLGTHIAALEIPDDDPAIRRDQVAKGGHCNLWGEPEEFLRRVTAITPVAAKGES